MALMLLLAALITPLASAAEKPSRWRTVWRVSQGLLAGADIADAASSWGKVESNPLLATGSRFSYGSLAIKMGALAGALTAQHFLVRRNREQAALYACANLAATGALSIVAVHNVHVPSAK
jgi:cytosine/uracil/thiamine/allantoin permease